MNIDRDILDIEEDIIEYRRHFHKNPESSLKEYETAKYIRNKLEEFGIEYKIVGETGTLGIINGDNANKTIFLRGDIDALELNDDTDNEYTSVNKGLNHACGHDAHAASLLGAARILNRRKDNIEGRIFLAFQPAEEIGSGARLFVKDGYLDEVDNAFGIHVDSSLETGKVSVTEGPQNASCDIFKIKIFGENAHVSVPHLGRDAVIATANIVTELQNIVSRQVNPAQPAVVGIGVMESGSRYNVIANEGFIQGTVRTFSQEIREDILRKIEKISKLTGEIHNCTVEFENFDAASPLINERESTKLAFSIAKKVVGEDNIITDYEKTMGAEDFADYLQKVPGTFLRVGTKGGEESSYPHHHNLFDIDESALKISVQLYVDYAVGFLNK